MELEFGPKYSDFNSVFIFYTAMGRALLWFIFTVIILVRLVKQLKSTTIDLLITTQYFILILCLTLDCISQGLIFLFDMKLRYGLGGTSEILLYTYFNLNLFWWYIMILHIEQANKIPVMNWYPRIKDQNNKFEKYSVIITSLIMIIFITTFLVLKIIKIESFRSGLITMEYVFKMAYWAVFIILSIILYFKLKNVLKKNLNYYYHRQRVTLFLLLIANISFMVSVVFLNTAIYFDALQIITEATKHIRILTRIIWVFFIILINLTAFFVILYNVNNINFKIYLQTIYHGLGISQHYEGASIFIKQSCWARNESEMTADDSDSEVEDKMCKLLQSTDSEDTEVMTESQKERELNSYSEVYRKVNCLP